MNQVFENGDVDAGIWTCGMCVGLIKDVPTCKELLETMEREAEETIARVSQLVVSKPRAKL